MIAACGAPSAGHGAFQRQDRHARRCSAARSAMASSKRSQRRRNASRRGVGRPLGLRRGHRPARRATDHVRDVAGLDLFGICVNQPARGMTGWNWDCSEECYRHAPELYGAIHFHDDDLDDCGWETGVALDDPGRPAQRRLCAARSARARPRTAFRSSCCPPRGTATARTRCSSCRRRATSPTRTTTSSTTCLSPSRSSVTPRCSPSRTSTSTATSTSDCRHTTRTQTAAACCFSSSRRPIMNMRPDFRHATGSVWQFPADLHLVDWLDEKGYEYDVVTDLELHYEGARLLAATASCSPDRTPSTTRERMLDAWEEYLADGGRAMYLGSNGFYWVTSWHPEKPWMIEVRKCESGLARVAGEARRVLPWPRAASEAGSGAPARARRRSSSASVSRRRASTAACGFQQMPDAARPARRVHHRRRGPR